ncbi:hypothetical protein GCM10010383_30610 [Streptomyces lomondensis]|uniref:Uncharacterized protein n=1 Tax=Streptomyces lomondensis TaxID=68229 RepID=A0ABQ2X3U9_9ACTN|nr:hypothetical protein GCM10010383_30610 [Streptomyces lomondensis]
MCGERGDDQGEPVVGVLGDHVLTDVAQEGDGVTLVQALGGLQVGGEILACRTAGCAQVAAQGTPSRCAAAAAWAMTSPEART